MLTFYLNLIDVEDKKDKFESLYLKYRKPNSFTFLVDF